MSARFEAAHGVVIGTAWHGENFHRTKRLKPIDQYLKPPKVDADQGARDLREMIARMRAKQASQG